MTKAIKKYRKMSGVALDKSYEVPSMDILTDAGMALLCFICCGIWEY